MKGKAAGGKAAVIWHYWLRENPKRASAGLCRKFLFASESQRPEKIPAAPGETKRAGKVHAGRYGQAFYGRISGVNYGYRKSDVCRRKRNF